MQAQLELDLDLLDLALVETGPLRRDYPVKAHRFSSAAMLKLPRKGSPSL